MIELGFVITEDSVLNRGEGLANERGRKVQLHRNQGGLRAFGKVSQNGRLGQIVTENTQEVMCLYFNYLFICRVS